METRIGPYREVSKMDEKTKREKVEQLPYIKDLERLQGTNKTVRCTIKEATYNRLIELDDDLDSLIRLMLYSIGKGEQPAKNSYPWLFNGHAFNSYTLFNSERYEELIYRAKELSKDGGRLKKIGLNAQTLFEIKILQELEDFNSIDHLLNFLLLLSNNDYYHNWRFLFLTKNKEYHKYIIPYKDTSEMSMEKLMIGLEYTLKTTYDISLDTIKNLKELEEIEEYLNSCF
jgi:hypothetical protein